MSLDPNLAALQSALAQIQAASTTAIQALAGLMTTTAPISASDDIDTENGNQIITEAGDNLIL